MKGANFRFATQLKLLIVAVLGMYGVQCFAQKGSNTELLLQYEDSMRTVAPEIQNGAYDFNKYEASEKLMRMLTAALEEEGAYAYPFDSLKTISVLRAPDNFFRIFTWNLRKSDGSYDYFGLLHVNPSKTGGESLFRLTNSQEKSHSSMNDVLMPDNWFGAHYYNIIRKKGKDNTVYTLLGWDGHNGITTRKIIDVLVFDAHGQPEFGTPLFNVEDELFTRYIIEYASHVSVSLKYEKQYLYKGKSKKWMIVFDRVSPLSAVLEGHYEFYVPEADTYDAFLFEDGYWFFYADVDARNPKTTSKAIRERKKKIESLRNTEK